MFKVITVICLLAIVLVMPKKDFFRPQTIRFYVFNGSCPEYPNVPIHYGQVKIKTINRTFYINMKLFMDEDVKSEELRMLLYLRRCQSRDALNCESYKTIKLNNFCSILTGDNKPWTPFRQRFEPSLTGCPFKKGIHEVKNGTFDVSKFPHIPAISDIYWKIKVILMTVPEERVIMCNLVEGQIAPA